MWCIYAPERYDLVGEMTVYSWLDAKKVFIKWLEYLKSEVLEPDLWENLSKYQVSVETEISEDVSNELFTEYQIDKITESLNQVKAFLHKNKLVSKEHNRFVEDNLSYLAEAAKRQGRKDWLYLCIGVITNIAINLVLNPEQTNTIWNIIKSSVASFIKLLQ